jgi:hypothetical protein
VRTITLGRQLKKGFFKSSFEFTENLIQSTPLASCPTSLQTGSPVSCINVVYLLKLMN